MARTAKQQAALKKAQAASAAKRKAKHDVSVTGTGLPKPLKGGRAQLIGGEPHNQYGQKITAKQYLSLRAIDSRDANWAKLMKSLNNK